MLRWKSQLLLFVVLTFDQLCLKCYDGGNLKLLLVSFPFEWSWTKTVVFNNWAVHVTNPYYVLEWIFVNMPLCIITIARFVFIVDGYENNLCYKKCLAVCLLILDIKTEKELPILHHGWLGIKSQISVYSILQFQYSLVSGKSIPGIPVAQEKHNGSCYDRKIKISFGHPDNLVGFISCDMAAVCLSEEKGHPSPSLFSFSF